MFTVHGFDTDGSVYAVQVADEEVGGTCIVGASPLTFTVLLDAHAGERFGPGEGGVYALDMADPVSVLTALRELTQVTAIDGTPPARLSVPAGAVV